MIMKKYCVIKTNNGAVGYAKSFETKENAISYFELCRKAILIVRYKYRERVLKSKGLSNDEVKYMMG